MLGLTLNFRRSTNSGCSICCFDSCKTLVEGERRYQQTRARTGEKSALSVRPPRQLLVPLQTITQLYDLSRPGLYLFWMTRLRRWLCELDSWSADLAVVVVVAGTQSLHRTSYGQHTSHVGNRVGRHTGCKDLCQVHPHQRIGRLLFDHSVCMISLHFVNFCLNICCSGPSQSMC